MARTRYNGVNLEEDQLNKVSPAVFTLPPLITSWPVAMETSIRYRVVFLFPVLILRTLSFYYDNTELHAGTLHADLKILQLNDCFTHCNVNVNVMHKERLILVLHLVAWCSKYLRGVFVCYLWQECGSTPWVSQTTGGQMVEHHLQMGSQHVEEVQ